MSMEYTPRNYKQMFDDGEVDLDYLIKEGFRQSSRKYRTISKKWKAYRKNYESSITLTEEKFEEFHSLHLEYLQYKDTEKEVV